MYIKFKDGKSKVFTMSYDDGVFSDIRLSDIMKKNGLKGTFNINSGCYFPEDNNVPAAHSQTRRLKLSEAKKLYLNSGNEVALHTYNHLYIENLENAELIKEIFEDRKAIENDYETIATGMAYPFGSYNDNIIKALELCGVSYCRTTKSTENFKLPDNWLTLHPTCHHNNPRLNEIAKRFVEDDPRWQSAWMFYLWGHSYEFVNNDNWSVIEDFAEYIGNRDDIWYATNIEIFNYVKAYKSLQTNIDKSIIHNPTSTDVWIAENNRIIKISAGETLNIKSL